MIFQLSPITYSSSKVEVVFIVVVVDSSYCIYFLVDIFLTLVTILV